MVAIHFARVLPANRRREARTVSVCSGIVGLSLTTDPWRVTCERCLRTVGPERERQARDDAPEPYDAAIANGYVPRESWE